MFFEKNSKVLFIGDSISDYGRARPIGQGHPDALGTSYVADVNAILSAMYPEDKINVVNVGTSGNRIRDLKERWENDVTNQHPDYVCVLIGINDVWRQYDAPFQTEIHVLPEEYEKTYDELIQKTLQTSKGMVLMTPYYMIKKGTDEMRNRMDEYGAIVKKMGEKYNLPVVDLQEAFDQLFTKIFPYTIAGDRIHPNKVGAMYIAKTFLNQLGYTK